MAVGFFVVWGLGSGSGVEVVGVGEERACGSEGLQGAGSDTNAGA